MNPADLGNAGVLLNHWAGRGVEEHRLGITIHSLTLLKSFALLSLRMCLEDQVEYSSVVKSVTSEDRPEFEW